MLSARVSGHPAFNDEVLAREMYARYVVGPGAHCVGAMQADGDAQFEVDVSNRTHSGGPSPYMEVHSSPQALRTPPVWGHLRPADGVWVGPAWAACRAVPWAYPDRTCATNALRRWRGTDPKVQLT